ncbi:MAG: hypothetical protein H6Q14_1653 [Bacteroidetes bacterium]|nr:hypothetical protein [Bacteroidota bacterium]
MNGRIRASNSVQNKKNRLDRRWKYRARTQHGRLFGGYGELEHHHYIPQKASLQRSIRVYPFG